MKLTKNWKRIFAGFMAGILLFLSVDAGSMAAFAVEKEENLLAGRVPVELISVVVISGLSCSLACGILIPRPGIKVVSPVLQG